MSARVLPAGITAARTVAGGDVACSAREISVGTVRCATYDDFRAVNEGPGVLAEHGKLGHCGAETRGHERLVG